MSFSQENFTILAREQGHSEDYINECLRYASNLTQNNLPVIFSPRHLELILGITNLKSIIDNRQFYYQYYQIKKRSGNGFRQIVVPFDNLKAIQEYINSEILSKVSIHESAKGFACGQSILQNALPHKNAPAILNLDLAKFFDTIPEWRVYRLFKSLGYAKNLSVDLAKLTTVQLPDEYIMKFSESEMKSYRRLVKNGEAVLPQGAPTSPSLSNLILQGLDKRLSALAMKLNVQYTRYADDITFSGDLANLPKIKLLRHIIKDEHLNINWQKVGIYKKGRKQLVTGLTISNDVHVHRTFKKNIKKHIYCCIKFGVENHKKHLGIDLGYYKEWLLGKIYFIKSIEPKAADQMLADFNKISWPL